MNIKHTTLRYLLFISLASLLFSCKSNRFFETDYDVEGIVQLDETQYINQSVDLFLHYPYDEVTDITWVQTSGESLTILAHQSKVISFTPTQAGEYGISVTFSLNDEASQTLNTTVIVEEQTNLVTARLSHEALANNNVSFRAEIQDSIDLTSLTWLQIAGPDVTISPESTDGELAVFFEAPQVNNDTIITFNVSANNIDNETVYNDQVAVLVEPASEINESAYFSDRKAKVFAFNTDSPYATDIVNCVYSNTLTSSCSLEKTPLLANEIQDSTLPPDIESIMDRVVVSHRWMGINFRDFLLNNDTNDDFKNLLRATTAIVISYDIRPSFYWAATGAIYLDPENLWLTPQERDTINEAEDFRANFGNDLQFVMPWRYVKDNAYASQSYSKSSRDSRTTADALYRLSALMYHELAHANDFFPKSEWYTHSSSQRVLDAAISSNFESDELSITYPLSSQEMFDLAQVRFAGESATSIQRNYLPIDIEVFFAADSASDFYAYSSEREDFAMLFEELMMQSRFSVLRDTAITNKPTGDTVYANDYIVTWGQRGRIGDDNVRERVLFSASRVLPEFDSTAAMQAIELPIEMTAGNDWIENLDLTSDDLSTNSTLHIEKSISASSRAKQGVNVEVKSHDFSHYYHKSLPNN